MWYAASRFARAIAGSMLLFGVTTACSSAIPQRPLGASSVVQAAPANELAARQQDLGRRNPHHPVRVVVLLHYNHELELRRLVDAFERAKRPKYLTLAAFSARYYPTPEQEQRVADALRHVGFRVVQRFADRLLVDAVAPSGVVERFFGTEIHDFRRPGHEVRAANVRPIRVPATLTSLVASVDANDLVSADTDIEFARRHSPAPLHTDIESFVRHVDAVRNGTFATGNLSPWRSCGGGNVVVSQKHPYSQYFDVLTGSTNRAEEPRGWSAICQRVKVPQKGVLSAWFYELTNEPNMQDAYQEVALADAAGKPTIVLI